VVENTGDVDLYDLQVTDNLVPVFGAGSIFQNMSVTADNVCGGNENGGYDAGATSDQLLAGGSASGITLPVSAICNFTVAFDVNPTNAGPYQNTASTTATDPDNATLSDSDNETTDFSMNPAISVGKTLAAGPTNNQDGTFHIEYQIVVSNTGDVNVYNLQIADDLAAVYGAASIFQNMTVAADSVCGGNENGGYSGTGNNDLLAGGATSGVTLPVSGVCTFTVAFDVNPENAGPYTNNATATADDPDGGPVTDSDDETTDFSMNPAMSVGKTLSAGPTNNQDGTFHIGYQIVVSNTGDVDLYNLQLSDDLAAVYGAASIFQNMTVDADSVCDTHENGGYTGTGNNELLALGASSAVTLPVNGVCIFDVSFDVNPENAGPYTNNVVTTTDDPDGDPVTDSDDETTDFSMNPAFDVGKTLAAGPTNNQDGVITICWHWGLLLA